MSPDPTPTLADVARQCLEAAEKATPGPWRWDHDNESRLEGDLSRREVCRLRCTWTDTAGKHRGGEHTHPDQATVLDAVWTYRQPYIGVGEADAQYIALANPDTVRRLARAAIALEEVERALTQMQVAARPSTHDPAGTLRALDLRSGAALVVAREALGE